MVIDFVKAIANIYFVLGLVKGYHIFALGAADICTFSANKNQYVCKQIFTQHGTIH